MKQFFILLCFTIIYSCKEPVSKKDMVNKVSMEFCDCMHHQKYNKERGQEDSCIMAIMDKEAALLKGNGIDVKNAKAKMDFIFNMLTKSNQNCPDVNKVIMDAMQEPGKDEFIFRGTLITQNFDSVRKDFVLIMQTPDGQRETFRYEKELTKEEVNDQFTVWYIRKVNLKKRGVDLVIKNISGTGVRVVRQN